ncbi:uncharacterized protein CLUP02_14617 [Colletotrichum lupini]|uniref:Uncharacterized protein n=1 Tax=Colletotrichum lupini TaxID=145971 RepID=A0A9Q8T4I1_9PEZI|nr:uncharacterized protein CLUP02_14617 [Colletotrichum lupini]UQC89089.1 hypothetical protein CLUP02_14617 [Colletotrichum lupini]
MADDGLRALRSGREEKLSRREEGRNVIVPWQSRKPQVWGNGTWDGNEISALGCQDWPATESSTAHTRQGRRDAFHAQQQQQQQQQQSISGMARYPY